MAEPAHGDGSDNPKSGSGSDSDQSTDFMTTEQFNRAFTGRMKQFEKVLFGKIDETLSEFGSKIQSSSSQKGESDGDEGDDDQGGKVPPEVANAMKSLKARLTRVETDNKSLRTQLSERDQAVANERMRRQALDELSKHGIQGQRATHALGFLADASEKIRLGESGEPIFHNGEYEQPLEEGLADWAKSEEADLYKPPIPDQGSGERGGGVEFPQGDDLKSAVLRHLQRTGT